MTWEEKFAAFHLLADSCLRMRKPGDWYVSSNSIEVLAAGSGMLVGEYGNGTTPEAAVNDHWRKLVEELPTGARLIVGAMRPDRREVVWHKEAWIDLKAELAAS